MKIWYKVFIKSPIMKRLFFISSFIFSAIYNNCPGQIGGLVKHYEHMVDSLYSMRNDPVAFQLFIAYLSEVEENLMHDTSNHFHERSLKKYDRWYKSYRKLGKDPDITFYGEYGVWKVKKKLQIINKNFIPVSVRFRELKEGRVIQHNYLDDLAFRYNSPTIKSF